MTNVKLLHFTDSRHVRNIWHCKAMPCVNRQANLTSQRCSVRKCLECLWIVRVVSVSPGVKLNGVRPERSTGLHGIDVRINEKACTNACVNQPLHRIMKSVPASNNAQAALRRDLLTTLGNQRHLGRPHPQGNGKHFVGVGHFQIQQGSHLCSKTIHIPVLDVPPVFSKMSRDSVRARIFTQQCGGHRVRRIATASLSNRRDVVNVDVESQVASRW